MWSDIDTAADPETTGLPEGVSRIAYGRRRVVLRCGSAVYFPNANLAPRAGEVMPCLRHGYCGVEEVEPTSPATLPTRRRAPRRTAAELLAHVRVMGTCTLANLRSERFTLRLVNDAVREGSITIDVDRDDLLVHPFTAADADYVPVSETGSGPAPRRLEQSW